MSNEIIRNDIRKLDEKLDQYGQGLIALADGLQRQTKLIEDIHKACTTTRPKSPLLDAVKDLAASMQASTSALEGLLHLHETQPESVRQVIREELDRKGDGE